MKIRIEEHLVYYSNEKQILSVSFCLTTGLFKFYPTRVKMGIAPGGNKKHT